MKPYLPKNSLEELLRQATKKLAGYSPTPRLDAEVLLSDVISKEKIFLYSYPEKIISKKSANKFQQLVTRRKKLEPIAYLTHQKEFYGLPFYVDKNVLIPRPDTELIVDLVISRLSKDQRLKTICDIGTGSGCIAIAIKKNYPAVKMLAADISKQAMLVAKKNARLNNTSINFFTSNLLKKIPRKYFNKINILIFNPPYLTKNEAKKTSLKCEPVVALTPDNIKKLLQNFFLQSQKFIAKSGIILLEIGHRQAPMIKKIAQKYYPTANIKIIKDLGGFNRVIRIDL